MRVYADKPRVEVSAVRAGRLQVFLDIGSAEHTYAAYKK